MLAAKETANDLVLVHGPCSLSAAYATVSSYATSTMEIVCLTSKVTVNCSGKGFQPSPPCNFRQESIDAMPSKQHLLLLKCFSVLFSFEPQKLPNAIIGISACDQARHSNWGQVLQAPAEHLPSSRVLLKQVLLLGPATQQPAGPLERQLPVAPRIPHQHPFLLPACRHFVWRWMQPAGV